MQLNLQLRIIYFVTGMIKTSLKHVDLYSCNSCKKFVLLTKAYRHVICLPGKKQHLQL